ncbi:MAG: glycosyltransferase, partial [Vulcanimicrobiaceae bacterium]
MGRIARGVLAAVQADPRFTVTLLADGAAARALRAEFPNLPIEPLGRVERRGAYDVVWFPFNGMRRRARMPSVVTIHDAFAFSEPARGLVARAREQQPIRRAARNADRIVADSHWAAGELARTLGIAPERIAVVRPEPDRFFFPALDEALPQALAHTRFALVVGAGEPRKNVALALESCARALHSGEPLIVVGTLARNERALARRLRVRCSEVSASDALLRTLYRRAEVVLVPSRAEGFG